MAKEFFIPKLGQTVEEVIIIQWLVEDGEKVERGQEILEVETDKAVFPIEANANGYLHRGPYSEGDVVPVLTVVAVIGRPDDVFQAPEDQAPAHKPISTETVAPMEVEGRISQRVVEYDKRIPISPRAKRLAKLHGVNIAYIKPTGGEGIRVVEKDVQAYLDSLTAVTPVAKRMASKAGIDLRMVVGSGPHGRIQKADVTRALRVIPVDFHDIDAPPLVLPKMAVSERVPLCGVRRVIAERMAMSTRCSARVTLFMDVDATEFIALREYLREKVEVSWGFAPNFNDLLAKIVAHSLRTFPYMNARMTEDSIEILDEINLGIAVETNRGLIVPVIRGVDRLSLRAFGKTFRDLADKVRQGRALPDELSCGTFTITNLGMYDVDAFTPIINLPESAILGFGRISSKLCLHDGEVIERKVCTLSLAFDHRLVDGAPAARFLQHIKDLMEKPGDWLLEKLAI